MTKDTAQPLIIERLINAPSEKVWSALTDAEKLKQWLPIFPEFRAEVGFETRFLLGPKGREYPHICRITEVEEGKKLTYTWYYDGYDGMAYVTFELTPEDDRTKLTLTHIITEPFPAGNPDFSAKNAEMGWNYTADALRQYAEK